MGNTVLNSTQIVLPQNIQGSIDGQTLSINDNGEITWTVNGTPQKAALESYGGSTQDFNPAVTVNGDELQIVGNGWKKVPLAYELTPNTVLEFDFRSTTQGEIHGIGFDTDNSLSENQHFKLYGTQDWGINNFNNYASNAGEWKSYQIKVGDFFTGYYDYLTFANDDDDANPNGSGQFRNIELSENNNPIVEPSSPFTYADNEEQLLLSTFDASDNFGEGWTLASGVAVENGELVLVNGEWQTANYDLAPLNYLDLDNGSFSLYWSARGERTKTESAKFFVEANLSPDSEGEKELKMAVRPSRTGLNPENEYHHLYVDGGFQVTHKKDSFLHVPGGQFADPNTYEQFRLKVEKTGENRVEVSPFYWDEDNSLWQPFADFLDKSLTSDDWTPPVPTPMSLSITDDLGQDFFDSLTLRFRRPGYSAIDAFAITSAVQEKVILEDNLTDLSNWTELRELISWGDYSVGTSGFSTGMNEAQPAVFLNRSRDGELIDTTPWTGTSGN